jgi:hypothetical protein
VRLHLWLGVLIVVVLLGSIPATLARLRGRSFGRWWLYGALFFPVALLSALRITATPGASDVSRSVLLRCPRCDTHVQANAPRCYACGSPLAQGKQASLSTVPPSRFKTRQAYERWKAERRQ